MIDDVLEQLRRREPLCHREEFGRTRADFERILSPNFFETGRIRAALRAELSCSIDWTCAMHRLSMTSGKRANFACTASGSRRLLADLHAVAGWRSLDPASDDLGPIGWRLASGLSPGHVDGCESSCRKS